MTAGDAYTCAHCEDQNPTWRVDRIGDAVVSWACDEHLAQECLLLQRAHEITELSLRLCKKERLAAEAYTKLAEG